MNKVKVLETDDFGVASSIKLETATRVQMLEKINSTRTKFEGSYVSIPTWYVYKNNLYKEVY